MQFSVPRCLKSKQQLHYIKIVFAVRNYFNYCVVFKQRLGSGLNPRLENVLQQRADSTASEAKLEEVAKAAEKAENKSVADVKILKGLQGLSPQLLEMLKAREKAKQIKNMTQSSQEQKELEMMEELITVSRNKNTIVFKIFKFHRVFS